MAERVAALLPEDVPAVRRVPTALLHITLAFIGHVPAERKDAIAAALAPASRAAPPLRLELRGLGQFPPGGRPRTLWVGLNGASAERLGVLAEQVRDALARADVPFDPKQFRPHVTLGRVRPDVPASDATAISRALRGQTTPIRARADAVSLVESVLSPKGPRYTTLERFPLGGRAQEGSR